MVKKAEAVPLKVPGFLEIVVGGFSIYVANTGATKTTALAKAESPMCNTRGSQLLFRAFK